MKQFLVIGNSAAGISAAEAIRRKEKTAKVTIVSDEDYVGYNRCLLSYFLAGDIKEDKLIYKPREFYADNNIELILNKKAVRIDVKKNQVVLDDKVRLDYDVLLLACGASAKLPDIKGVQKNGVFGLRSIRDVRGIAELIPVASAACVLGGGLIGLKAAYALSKRKIEVKVIVKSHQLLSQILDSESAAMFMRRLTENGIEIITGVDCSEIIGNGEVKAVKLDSGKVIASSIVVVGKGVKPNIELAKDAGLNTDEGILVDDYLRTSIPNIYAAGDITQTYDPILGKKVVNALWPNAVEQGMLVGENILGQEAKHYQGSVGMNSVEFFGLPVISFGLTKAGDPAWEELVSRDLAQVVYKKIILKDNIIKGAILVGKIENIGVLLKLARLKVDVSQIKGRLLQDEFNFTITKDLNYDKEEIYL